MKRLQLKSSLFLFIIFFSSGCSSLFFGNVKPITEKSSTYQITSPTQFHADWVQISSHPNINPIQGKWSPDATYQSTRTSAIISINTVCKYYASQERESLKDIANQLTLGITNIQIQSEEDTRLSGLPAWQTTFTGKTDHHLTQFRTIVLKKGNCTYDLMYLSKLKFFLKNLDDFSKFSNSLKIQ